MSPQGLKPGLFSRKGKELSLSGPALSGLLQAVLEKRVPFRFRVRGFSMSPFIKDEDIVTISPLSGASPSRGDVVAFFHLRTAKLIIHRVVWKDNNFYVLKGDSSPKMDELIPKGNILGHVARVERNGKRILFGFGPERYLIAFLTRSGFFTLLGVLRKALRSLVRKSVS